MELPARRLPGFMAVAAIALALASPSSIAQTSGQPDSSSSGGVGDQLKSGAQRIGEGAERIGEGIKQGAIQGWEAVKAGATAAADKLNNTGNTPAPPPAAPPPPPGDAPR